MSTWTERPLFGNERMKGEAWFSQGTGWRWQVMLFDDDSGWVELDSGTTTLYLKCLEHISQVFSDVAAGLHDF